MGNICACATEKKLPVLLSFYQTDIRELKDLIFNFPEVNFIVTEIYYRNIRNFYFLLEACENLFVETSFCKTSGSLEFLCERVGAKRLVFGTGSPYYDAGAAIAMLLGAEITPDERELIAHGNIESLCRLEAFKYDY